MCVCEFVRFSVREQIELGIFASLCESFKVAYVLGVHFRADEWGERRRGNRCGSVVTTVYGGISRYCIVHQFLRIRDKQLARVTWFSKPYYPYAPIPLVARVSLPPVERQNRMPSFVSLDMIDPTSVIVEPDQDGVHYYMMRLRGFDISS